MSIDRTNAICGAFLIFVGALFASQSLLVPLGTWLKIGPGGLPLVLSVALIVLGVFIMISKSEIPKSEGSGEGLVFAPWRALFFILLAPVIFAFALRPLGFVIAVFLTAFFASFASAKMKLHWALGLAVALTVFTTLVFSYGLRLPLDRVGTWLRPLF